MIELADIIRRYGREYLERFGAFMLPEHHRAFWGILNCRTEAMGGHVLLCDHCGKEEGYSYHSCKNRNCPKCSGSDTERWLEKRRAELLPVPYFHVIFTLPRQLRECVRSNQRILYSILMKAAAASLLTLARDPHYVGGLIGIMCVLHTWTRALLYHPHVHCLVPAGGMNLKGSFWIPANENFLVPVMALKKIFRGKFKEMVEKELPGVYIPDEAWTIKWHVYSKPAMQGSEQVLNYLSRYVYRVAITNSRILSITDGNVTFRYKDSRDRRWKTMTLPSMEFIRRFMQHVLPANFHKIRYYGLWSPANRTRLHQIQIILHNNTMNKKSDIQCSEMLPSKTNLLSLEGTQCPHCAIGVLRWVKKNSP